MATTRQMIAKYLERHPDSTARQIATGLNKSAGLVSGILTGDRDLRRVKVSRKKGPRGGVVYTGYSKPQVAGKGSK